MPELNFRVEGAEAVGYAAVPTLLFKLRVENLTEEPVRSIALNTQLRIATTQRQYNTAEQERLLEVFGEAHRWGETLRSVLWTNLTVQVPAFNVSAVVDLPVTCTYDFEVISAKYLNALEGGTIPLEFLFSGTVFYAGTMGLQVARIPWDKEARFNLPVCVWRYMIEYYFPNSAWLRLRKDVFDQLYNYKARNGFPTWEATLEDLFRTRQKEVET